MVLHFIKQAIKESAIPEKLIDQNVKIDYNKLRYLITLDKQLNGNFSELKRIVEKQSIVANIAESFPVKDLSKKANFISLLYYFGLLTIDRELEGMYLLKIPNITIQKLMYEYIRSGFEDVEIFKVDMWELSQHMREMAFRGNWHPFFQFLSDQIEQQTSIRDYLNGEKVIQGFLLAYLNVTDFYITQSEQDMNKGFSDIYLEPFSAKFPDLQYAYLIELKYITRSDFSQKVLDENITKARKQLDQYSQSDRVQKSIGTTQLKKIVLVYNGWELCSCEEYK